MENNIKEEIKERWKFAFIKAIKHALPFTILMYLFGFIPGLGLNRGISFYIVLFILMFIVYLGLGYYEFARKNKV